MVGTIEFLTVLGILYILECLRLVRPGELVVDRSMRGAWIVRRPLFWPNERWGWILLNPFRALGGTFCLRPASWAFTGNGVLTLPDLTFLPYARCEFPSEDASPADARRFVEMLQAVRDATPEARSEHIRARAKQAFDVREIFSIVENFETATKLLRALVTAQFAVCFLLFPVAAYLVGLSRALLALAPVALLLSMTAMWQFRSRVAKLRLEPQRLDYYGNLVKVGLYPVAMLRAIDILSFELLCSFETSAVAAELCGREPASRIAAREYRNLKFRAAEGSDVFAEYRRARLELLDWFDGAQRLAMTKLLVPPAASGPESLSYCPNCGAQYRHPGGLCSDCPEIELQRFAGGRK